MKTVFQEPKVAKLRAALLRGHLLVSGPVGVGKTEYLELALKDLGAQPIHFVADRNTEVADLLSRKVYAGGKPNGPTIAWEWALRPLGQAMASGRTILISDIDTLLYPCRQIIREAMDGAVEADPQTGRPAIRAKDGFRVVATANKVDADLTKLFGPAHIVTL